LALSGPRAGYKRSPSTPRRSPEVPSCDTPIVVMEPTEYGDCVDTAVCLERPSNRLVVPEGLVRTRFVVEADVLVDDAPEVILAEDEHVVEHLSAERTGEAFSEGIHIRRAYRRAHHAHPRRSENVSEPRVELRIMIADDHLRSAVHGGVPSLLRAPLVGRCIRDRSMEDRPAMQVQEEEYKYLAERNEGAATSVWC